uniref:Small ribosomal subunit protein mS41 SAM domain-containing protein n=1 Tax=Rhizophora mucronata TaxID=61149 RepID=A0A2P2KGY0_RHIMU
MAWRQITRVATQSSNPALQPHSAPGLYRFFSKSAPYLVKVGIPEFLNGIGKGVEAHVPKLETEIGDIQKLLVTRTLKLKKLGIPCKHRKLILDHAHKFRLGLWRPRVQPLSAK